MALYKGDALVLTGSEGNRDPFGAWSTTYTWEGIPGSVAALIANQALGSEINVSQHGYPASARITYPPNVFSDKWETDRENLDKDIMYNPAFIGISIGAFKEVRRWRQDPTGSDMCLTPGVPIPKLLDENDKPSALTLNSNDVVLMAQIRELVLRGAEAYQLSTLVLKRTRKIAASMLPTINLAEKTIFYSTATLTANEGVPPLGLPIVPYTPPSNAQWGWLPRQNNRSYVSRGFYEEHCDWVFAAWSTVLYTYAP